MHIKKKKVNINLAFDLVNTNIQSQGLLGIDNFCLVAGSWFCSSNTLRFRPTELRNSDGRFACKCNSYVFCDSLFFDFRIVIAE